LGPEQAEEAAGRNPKLELVERLGPVAVYLGQAIDEQRLA
jgi:hypothetical protein